MTGANFSALIDGMTRVPDPPCLYCRLAQRCASKLEACRQFAEYVDHGVWRASSSRVPSAATYRAIYASTDTARAAPKAAA